MCDSASSSRSCPTGRRHAIVAVAIGLLILTTAARASAADQMYFAATDNITDVLVQRINAETVRVDISCWYLTEHAISIALINKFNAGVPVRLIGDRGSIFEIDRLTSVKFVRQLIDQVVENRIGRRISDFGFQLSDFVCASGCGHA